jgi:WD40 repeat protein
MDKLIRLWDPESGRLKKTLFGVGLDGIASLSFSPDGKLLASGGDGREEGGCVRIWDLEDGSVLHRLRTFKRGVPVRISFSHASNSLFAVAIEKGATEDDPAWEIQQWDALSGQLERVFPSRDGYCRAIAVSPNDRYVAVGTWEEEVLIYDTRETGEVK